MSVSLMPSILLRKSQSYNVKIWLCRHSVQFSSIAQSCPTLWDPMDCNTPRFPVLHQLSELVQTHVH